MDRPSSVARKNKLGLNRRCIFAECTGIGVRHSGYAHVSPASSVAIVGVSTSEGPDAITVKPAGGILGWMGGRLGVTAVLFISWNGMCMELGGEI